MEQGESRFSDSQKLSIKKAIWLVFEIRSCLSSPDEYEKQLCDHLQREFPLNDCIRHRLVGSYVPDIVIKDVGVIEVKCVRWANIDSTTKGRIETYMMMLSMPGLMVNFPHSGFPYLRWYYLDENEEPKLERVETLDSNPEPNLDENEKSKLVCVETLDSDPEPNLDENEEPKLLCVETLDSDPEPTFASQASSKNNLGWSEAFSSQASSKNNSRWSEAFASRASSKSNSGWSEAGTALGVGLGVVAAALALGFAFSKEKNKDENKSKDDESD